MSSNSDVLRVAVIGAGHLGKIHARLLPEVEGVDVVAIADPSPSIQRELIETTDVPVISDYRKVIDEIDAAVVATPTRSHFEIANELLGHGIHCLIEKPITDCPWQARQLAEIAIEQDCVLSVGHVEQFNPALQFAFERAGIPKFIQASRTSGYTFRSTDIGVVHDLMIHDIDLCNTAFPGKMIRSHACGFSMFGGHEDIAQARIQFNCGGIANLTASRCSFTPQRNMQIFGTEGFAAVDLADHRVQSIRFPSWLKNNDVDFQSITPQQRDFVRDNLFTEVLPVEEVVPDRTNAILEEQRDWVNCIQNGEPLRNTAEAAAEAVRIAGQVLDQIDQHRWSPEQVGAGPHFFNVAPIDAIPAQLQPPLKRAA